jgi:hypothetical protein
MSSNDAPSTAAHLQGGDSDNLFGVVDHDK